MLNNYSGYTLINLFYVLMLENIGKKGYTYSTVEKKLRNLGAWGSFHVRFPYLVPAHQALL